MTYDPLEELQLLLAQPHMQALDRATKELLVLRNAFMPLYTYYFPQSWFAVIARTLHLRPQPDFSRHRGQLQRLRDDAWRIVEEARVAFEAIAQTAIDLPLKNMAEFGYRQAYYDGNVIILMNEFVKGMDERNPECAKYWAGMRDFSKKAHANLTSMQGLARTLERSQSA
jgi:hypothetical protein